MDLEKSQQTANIVNNLVDTIFKQRLQELNDKYNFQEEQILSLNLLISTLSIKSNKIFVELQSSQQNNKNQVEQETCQKQCDFNNQIKTKNINFPIAAPLETIEENSERLLQGLNNPKSQNIKHKIPLISQNEKIYKQKEKQDTEESLIDQEQEFQQVQQGIIKEKLDTFNNQTRKNRNISNDFKNHKIIKDQQNQSPNDSMHIEQKQLIQQLKEKKEQLDIEQMHKQEVRVISNQINHQYDLISAGQIEFDKQIFTDALINEEELLEQLEEQKQMMNYQKENEIMAQQEHPSIQYDMKEKNKKQGILNNWITQRIKRRYEAKQNKLLCAQNQINQTITSNNQMKQKQQIYSHSRSLSHEQDNSFSKFILADEFNNPQSILLEDRSKSNYERFWHLPKISDLKTQRKMIKNKIQLQLHSQTLLDTKLNTSNLSSFKYQNFSIDQKYKKNDEFIDHHHFQTEPGENNDDENLLVDLEDEQNRKPQS